MPVVGWWLVSRWASSTCPRRLATLRRWRSGIAFTCALVGVATAEPAPPTPLPLGASEATEARSPPASRPLPRSNAERPLDLGPSVMRAAVAEADRDYAPGPRGATFGSSAVRQRVKTDQAFDAATIEGCAGPNAFKFDPPTIGFIGFGGFLALPWWLHAIGTGRCKW